MSPRRWKIQARNLRTPYAEVDLLAIDRRLKPHCLVVIEVKARQIGDHLDRKGALYGEDVLRPPQRERLRRACEWLGEERQWIGPLRLDLVCVDLQRQRPMAYHWFEDIET